MTLRTLTGDEIHEMNLTRWWHRIPVGLDEDGTTVFTPGEVFHGPDGGDWPTTRFGLPEDLTGKTVLDVGAWDGFFSFEAERRGADQVSACDIPEAEGGSWGGTAGFELAKRLLGSQVCLHTLNLDSEAPKAFCATGYDLVLCYGVLYHVENPLRCCRNLFALTKPGGTCLVETAIDPDRTLAGYRAWTLLPGHEGDPTNFWYPTVAGLRQALELAGFTDVLLIYNDFQRVTVRAKRPGAEATALITGPEATDANGDTGAGDAGAAGAAGPAAGAGAVGV